MDSATRKILTELANGNYHVEPMIRAQKVGECDAAMFAGLTKDVNNLIANHPYSTVTDGHVTNWTKPVGEVFQWSLWNRQGRTNDTSEDFNYVLTGKHAPVGCGNIQNFASQLPSLVNLRLNYMMPGAALSPHEEHLPRSAGDDKVALRARFHLPIVTNPDALMLADHQWFRFTEGNVYVFNNGCVHGSVNNGPTPRAHLVWDMLMTEEAIDTMFKTGNDFFKITKRRSAPKVKGEPVLSYVPSEGMSKKDFDKRELIVHP